MNQIKEMQASIDSVIRDVKYNIDNSRYYSIRVKLASQNIQTFECRKAKGGFGMMCDFYPAQEDMDKMAGKAETTWNEYRNRVQKMLEALREHIAKMLVEKKPERILVVAQQWVLFDVMRITSEEWKKVFPENGNLSSIGGWGLAFEAGYVVDFANHEPERPYVRCDIDSGYTTVYSVL